MGSGLGREGKKINKSFIMPRKEIFKDGQGNEYRGIRKKIADFDKKLILRVIKQAAVSCDK